VTTRIAGLIASPATAHNVTTTFLFSSANHFSSRVSLHLPARMP
jgi:hypothetical protein